MQLQYLLQDPSLLHQQGWIGGAWCCAQSSAATFAIRNPASHEVLAQVADMDEHDTRHAIACATTAGPAWRALTGLTRGQRLRRWFELIEAHSEDLASIMTAEQGKPLAEARGEVAYAASFVEWFAEEARRVCGDVLDSPLAGKRLLVLKQAIGVCAAITPWNFPAAMITRKVAPALAAGCTVIVKPAEQTPLTALALAELAQRAGLPDGVLNVITGSAAHAARIGHVLTSDARVRKLSFTGSTEVGRLLMAQCAPTVKKLSLELGGNAPFIVFDDADLDAAVAGALHCKFRNTGQTCISANRFLVQSGIHDAFVARLATAMGALNVGEGRTKGVTIGPLIDTAALEKVDAHVADALTGGARLLCGGRPHALGGHFYEPTLLVDVRADMRCMREESFGPLAAVLRFEHEEDAIQLANDTEYGLAAYFYSRDFRRLWRVAEALEYGMLGINTSALSNEVGPFGGIKQSGIGREGSKYGIEEYLELKLLSMGL
ncbi:MAG: NAD-dependent succinate-semialdehyde dehydrogenase [Sterolibacterium sp.]|nr:NAD-dependent succinate-semialdehyde dehydrogenase [Sterolibacterium sp.]MBP9799970.1 NAD-dependent succinate-semialdehyde dehydrogenase [Sterolibacterium sp.]